MVGKLEIEYNVAQEVVYWEDIPSDSTFRVPFFYDHVDEAGGSINRFQEERDSLSKYLTFQPDNGGFNNIRMAFETALVLSVAMGRTLVLPPKQQYPLLVGSMRFRFLSVPYLYGLD